MSQENDPIKIFILEIRDTLAVLSGLCTDAQRWHINQGNGKCAELDTRMNCPECGSTNAKIFKKITYPGGYGSRLNRVYQALNKLDAGLKDCKHGRVDGDYQSGETWCMDCKSKVKFVPVTIE